ncbi:MAG: hypothetical protein DCF22_00550 [Leptolyngbya sp.]|nr:MAG: hypothetical protein DCF22_00550 [Leptolyngbya sp.]
MTRRSKYTPELAKKIFDTIAQTGSDRAGYEVAGISGETFYQWIKKNPEFSEGISKARTEYQDICPEALVRQANKSFADYLYGRVEISIATMQRKHNADGSTESKETIRKIRPGVARWAIERVLGKPMDILEAAKTFAAAGIIPHHLVQVTADEIRAARERITEAYSGTLPDGDIRRVRPGLSEETAAAIRAHILGIESADSAALSGEMGRRHEPHQVDGEVTADRD